MNFLDCDEKDIKPKFLPKTIPNEENSGYSYSIDKSIKIHIEIMECLRQVPTVSTIFTEGEARNISLALCDCLRYPISKCDTIFKSLYPYFRSATISEELYQSISLRIGGNAELIRKDYIIPTEHDPKVPIWIPVLVKDVTIPNHPKMRKLGINIHMRVAAGVFAGNTLEKYVSNKYAKYLLKQIGFNKYTRCTQHDLYNTMFTFKQELIDGKTCITDVKTSASQKRRNKEIHDARYGARPCYMGVVLPCSHCLKTTEECQYSVRKQKN